MARSRPPTTEESHQTANKRHRTTFAPTTQSSDSKPQSRFSVLRWLLGRPSQKSGERRDDTTYMSGAARGLPCRTEEQGRKPRVSFRSPTPSLADSDSAKSVFPDPYGKRTYPEDSHPSNTAAPGTLDEAPRPSSEVQEIYEVFRESGEPRYWLSTRNVLDGPYSLIREGERLSAVRCTVTEQDKDSQLVASRLEEESRGQAWYEPKTSQWMIRDSAGAIPLDFRTRGVAGSSTQAAPESSVSPGRLTEPHGLASQQPENQNIPEGSIPSGHRGDTPTPPPVASAAGDTAAPTSSRGGADTASVTDASGQTTGGGNRPGAGDDTAATGGQGDDTERIPSGYLASHDGRVYDPFGGYEYEPITREGNSVVWRRTQYRVQGGWRETKRQEFFGQLPTCDYVQPQTSVPGTQAPVQPLAEDTTIRSPQGDGGSGNAGRDAADIQEGFHQQEEDALSEFGGDSNASGDRAPENPRRRSGTAPPPQDESQPPDDRKPAKPGGNDTNPERQGTGDQSSQDGTGQPDGTAPAGSSSPAGSSAPTRTAPRKPKPKRRAQSANTSPLLKVYNSLRNTAGAVTSTFVSAVPPLIRGSTQLANSIWGTEIDITKNDAYKGLKEWCDKKASQHSALPDIALCTGLGLMGNGLVNKFCKSVLGTSGPIGPLLPSMTTMAMIGTAVGATAVGVRFRELLLSSFFEPPENTHKRPYLPSTAAAGSTGATNPSAPPSATPPAGTSWYRPYSGTLSDFTKKEEQLWQKFGNPTIAPQQSYYPSQTPYYGGPPAYSVGPPTGYQYNGHVPPGWGV